MHALLSALALLLGLLAPTLAHAQQQPECTSAFGQTVCGYHCESAYGELRCAQTPWGRCKAAYGKVVCGDGASWLTWRRGPVPRVECKAAYGEIACGYKCEAAYGQVRCAQTPEGRCESAYGQVTCWDPPAGAQRGPAHGARHPVRPVHPRAGQQRATPRAAAPATSWPEPTCRSAYGETACGYHCTAAYGQVRCAQTPHGQCKAAYGEVTCWDPPTR